MKIESMDRMFLPVGQGAFYCERFYDVEKGRDVNVVYDCGTLTGKTYDARLVLIKKVVDKYFGKEKDKVIDAVFISHLHEDHFNGLEYLVKKCKIRRIYLPQMDPLELKLMQLYYVAHHTSSVTDSGSGSHSLGEHFLKCNDLENDFPEALRKVMQLGDERLLDGDVPVVVPVGQEPIDVSGTIFGQIAETESLGEFANWKYKTFCIENVGAMQRVKDGLKQLMHDKLKIDVKTVTPKRVAKLIKNCRADKMFRREIRRTFRTAIGDFHTNSLVLYSGCDNTPKLYAHSEELPCKFLTGTDRQSCWMFTHAVGCLYTGDFKANCAKHWNQLKHGFKAEWETIGCVQIPHHGSRYNYNSEFLAMAPWHVASAGKRSRFRHPHKEVRAKYNCQCPLIVVTEVTNSFAKWRVEEKSSINVKILVADLNNAMTMRWFKESGATATFKISEINNERPFEDDASHFVGTVTLAR